MSTPAFALVQEKVFTKWCNTHLKNRQLKIEEGQLTKGALDSGAMLWHLLSELSSEVLPKISKNARMQIMMINNLNVSLKFIAEKKIKLVNIGGEDIVGHNVKCILGLIWTLILRYQITGGEDSGNSARNDLLEWLRSVGLKINNLTHDFADGKNLLRLCNILQADAISPNEITNNATDNANLAINRAATLFDIPKIVEASDIACENPDELCNMTYLSYFRERYGQSFGSVRLVGGNRVGKVGVPCVMTLKTKDVKLNQLGGEVTPPSSLPLPRLNFNSKSKGEIDAVFVPTHPGIHKVSLTFKGRPIKGTPITVNVLPATSARYDGPSEIDGKVGIPTTFSLTTEEVKKGDLKPDVKDKNGKSVPCVVTPNGDNQWDVTFTPTSPGPHLANVYLEDKKVDGLPVKVNVKPATELVLDSYPRTATAGDEYALNLKGKYVDPKLIKVKVADEMGHVPVPKVTEIPINSTDSNFKVAFTPEWEGPHKVQITYDGVPLDGTPFTLPVGPPEIEFNPCLVGRPYSILLAGENLRADQLVGKVTGPSGKAVKEFKVTDDGNDRFQVTFVAEERGKQTINLSVEGKPLAGTPVEIRAFPHIILLTTDRADLSTSALKPGDPLALTRFICYGIKPSELDYPVTGSEGGVDTTASYKDSEWKKAYKGEFADRDKKRSVYEVSFVPARKGKYTLKFLHKGKYVSGGNSLSLHVGVDVGGRLSHRPEQLRVEKQKPFTFHVNGNIGDLEQLSVVAKSDKGDTVAPNHTKIVHSPQGGYDITVNPQKEGNYTLQLNLSDQPVEGTQFDLAVGPKTSLIEADIVPLLEGEKYTFQKLRLPEHILQDIKVTMKNDKGQDVGKASVVKAPDGTYELQYAPKTGGNHTAIVEIDGVIIPQGPLMFNFPTPKKPEAQVSGNTRDLKAVVGKTIVLDVKLSGQTKGEDVSMDVTHPHGVARARTELLFPSAGNVKVQFTPNGPGKHHLELSLRGQRVENGSFDIDVAPDAVATMNVDQTSLPPTTFQKITLKGAQASDLNIPVKDRNGKVVGFAVAKDNGDGSFDLKFAPPQPGTYSADILVRGQHVAGPIAITATRHDANAPSQTRKKLDANTAYQGRAFRFALNAEGEMEKDKLQPIVRPPAPASEYTADVVSEDGKVYVRFTPQVLGRHEIEIFYDGRTTESMVTINVIES